MDFYNKYLDTSRKLKNVQKISESRIRELESEIYKLKIQLINPATPPNANKELLSILKALSEVSMVTPGDITGPERKRPISIVRFCFMHIAKEYGFTHSAIGRFVNRDHSTVIHGVNNFQSWIELGYKYETRIYNDAKKILECDTKN
jgi:chromosomal replication initiation ATPase DnaA